MPKVSVILPNYNHALYLQQRIDSILYQTYQDFELILLDDCSTDNSRQILNKYKNHPKVTHCLFNAINSGSTFKQWNKGILCAEGEYIWIAESDDWAEEDFLQTLITTIDQQTEPQKIGIAYSASKLIDSNGQITYDNEQHNSGKVILYEGLEFIQHHLLTTNVIWNASMAIFRHDCFPSADQQKLYDFMNYCGDWFLYTLIAEKGVEILELQRTLNYFRRHEQNVSIKAMATGMIFLEGLNILQYQNKFLPIKVQKRTAQIWAKKYCRAKRKNNYSTDTRKKIVEKIKMHPLILFYYFLYEPFYRLKYMLK